jgi:Dolichyl-phosphate-mannose-protein mannosyltransferase
VSSGSPRTDSATPRRWRLFDSVGALCVLLFLAALGARTLALTRVPLWYDERVSLVDSQGIRWPGQDVVSSEELVGPRDLRSIARFSATHDQPVYVALLHLWTEQWGTGEAALRALSAVAGATAVPLLFLAGRRLLGSSALLGATFFVFAPLHISLSKEARTYALTVAMVALSLVLMVEARHRDRVALWTAYGFAAGAIPVLHLLAGVTLVSQAAWLLMQRVPLRRLVLAAAGAMLPWLLATPLHIFESIATAHQQSGVALAAPPSEVRDWARPATPRTIAAGVAYSSTSLAGITLTGTGWRIRHVVWLAIPLFLAFAIGLRRLAGPERVLLGLGAAAPLLAAVVFAMVYGHVVPLEDRYMAWALPHVSLLLGHGAHQQPYRVGRALVVIPMLSWIGSLLAPAPHQDVVGLRKRTVSAVMACYGPGDLVSVPTKDAAMTFVAFGGHPTGIAIGGRPRAAGKRGAAAPAGARRLWVVSGDEACGVGPAVVGDCALPRCVEIAARRSAPPRPEP